MLRMLRMFRMSRMFRMFRIVRMFRIIRMFRKATNEIDSLVEEFFNFIFVHRLLIQLSIILAHN